jgi:polysaccharide export outer membrane protein
VLMPLIGSVTVAGKTPQEVSNDIATRLSVKYLQSPQVAVVVDQAAVQKVTVEGAVTQSGVFELSGNTTLLQAVAMAKGPNKTADLQNVIIFRTIDGKRQAARFDLTAIRSGAVPDVDVFGNDVVVLTDSGPKSMFRDIISSLPALGVFAYF